MNKLVFFVTHNGLESELFTNNINNSNKCFNILKASLEEMGYLVKVAHPREHLPFGLEVYIDNVITPVTANNGNSKLLLLWEHELIQPLNSPCLLNDDDYDHILTWRISHLSRKKYSRFYLPLPGYSSTGGQAQTKRTRVNHRTRKSVMFCGNKISNKRSRAELYSARVRVLNWFNQSAPSKLDLYGTGWNKFPAASIPGGGWPQKALNRARSILPESGVRLSQIYKGVASSKFETMRRYEFNICFENVMDSDGYITEKIFDSLVCQTFPIYCGGDLSGYSIPSDLFIAVPKEISPKGILEIIESIGDARLREFKQRALDFMNSDLVDNFRPENFAKIVLSKLLGYSS